MSEKDGGPAFPQIVRRIELSNNDNYVQVLVPEGGMSLRDYFAAKAMHAELVTDGSVDEAAKALCAAAARAGQSIVERIAVISYEMADAMLAARSKGRS